jgi:uncharacterized protein YfaS (alpha-2-macroglobulin family)
LARLGPARNEPGDAVDFRLRDRSLPPPAVGKIIEAAFADNAKNEVAPTPASFSAPLEVTRISPQGPVELAPAISLTFSQPMVDLSSQDEAAANVPVILTPQPAGTWRWLGTQTLMFQPTAEGGRLPMATDYTVTIPAGTRSKFGNPLREAKMVTFSTPPLAIVDHFPSDTGQPRDALIFLTFNQHVDAASILASIKLKPSTTGVHLRMATTEELAGYEQIERQIKELPVGRWIALRAVDANGATKDALPVGTQITLTIPKGTRSAEGPRATTEDQSVDFRTYDAFTVINFEDANNNQFYPSQSLYVRFNNAVDPASFAPSMVMVSPEIPGMEVSVAYNGIVIKGQKRSNTVYTVTIDRSLKDNFGQLLTGRNSASFKVIPALPRLFSTTDGFMILDPAAKRNFSVYSINVAQVRVRLSKVTPDDWTQFRKFQESWNSRENDSPPPPAPPGNIVLDQTVNVANVSDELVETSIDLTPAIANGHGQVLVRVDPVPAIKGPLNYYRQDMPVETWVQATDIGLDAFADHETMVAWANSLSNGKPLAGVAISVMPDGLTGDTDASGVARIVFQETSKSNEERVALLVARTGDDVAILPQSYNRNYYRNDAHSWRPARSSETLSWYVFDDRKLYRPGEEVTVKGWIRRIDQTPHGDTELFSVDGETVNYAVLDSEGNEVAKGSTKLNALAGFDLKVQLPPNMNLGDAELNFELESDGDEYTHRFRVEEFRRPEFEVTTESSKAPYLVGSNATASMSATYYTGGPLANTDVNWTVSSQPTNFTPPGREGFVFGKFQPWWVRSGYEPETSHKEFNGKTDVDGKHTLRIDFDSVNPARPSLVTAQARVQDINRQTLSSSTTLLVHPADLYVGLKPARTFVQNGENFDLSAILTDLEGKAVSGREIKLRLVRLDWVYENQAYIQKELDPQEQTVTSGSDAVSIQFPTTAGGSYRLIARVRDDRERLNETELSLWVAGGKVAPDRGVAQESVQLIPDRRTYADGDVAEILVQAPFAPAEGVMTLRRSGLLRTERFTTDSGSYTLHIPIDASMSPNLHVQVDLVGEKPRTGDDGNPLPGQPKRPAYASGELNLEVPPMRRRLKVTATPRNGTLEPGSETTVDVSVNDAQGKAVKGAETAVVVVDESVLALTEYKLPDPISIFYPDRDGDVGDYHTRVNLKLASPLEFGMLGQIFGDDIMASTTVDVSSEQFSNFPTSRTVQGLYSIAPTVARSGLRDASGRDPSVGGSTGPENNYILDGVSSGKPIALRQNFNALAVFAAAVPTNALGRAQVKVKMPDNLTRYRVMVVAVGGGKFAGAGESAITARKQLMVRPSAPRFLNFGDRAELPVVLQNQTNGPLMVNVAVRATNAKLTGDAGRRVTVPANDRIEIRFPFATILPGTANFQIVTTGAGLSDAAEVSLPVYTPATTEAMATYGTIDQGSIAQPVKAPADVVKSFGGLEVTTASTQLQELTDSVVYLVNYPYDCSEQISSRVLALAALKDVLTAFKVKDLPSPEQMRASVDTDLKRLKGMQNDDGGFDYWERGRPSDPFLSVHVAHALVRAKEKGFAVSDQTIENSKRYLTDIDSEIPAWYPDQVRWAIQSYAIFVRGLMKDPDATRARKIISDAGSVEKLSLESSGWILPVLAADSASAPQAAAIRVHVNNRVTETADAAHFADSYADGAYTILQSDRRADGILLDALIGDQPKSELIPKLVRGLLSQRTQGRWRNTQENVFILLALNRYFNTYEKAEPNFTARVWLGQSYAGEQVFKGRSVDKQQLNLPMAALAQRTTAGPVNLTIAKEGAGRLYYRIGTKYAPTNLTLAAADYGFRVERAYEAIDDPSDVRRDADGTWHIRAGARIRVRLRMINPARRYQVALVDPLPAGLEALNPEFATTEALPEDNNDDDSTGGGRGYFWRWRSIWYDHQNLRDDRVEAFTSMLWEGEHIYTYFARATTPGLFIVPPAKAEEMYTPETFGRGHSDKVKIE